MGSQPEIPVSRGRRNPELALELAKGPTFTSDGEEIEEEQDFSLLVGDTLMAKTSISYNTALGEAWSTLGATTRITDEESVDEALGRLFDTVNGGVMELAEDEVNRVNELVERRRAADEAAPARRIMPQHRGRQ